MGNVREMMNPFLSDGDGCCVIAYYVRILRLGCPFPYLSSLRPAWLLSLQYVDAGQCISGFTMSILQLSDQDLFKFETSWKRTLDCGQSVVRHAMVSSIRNFPGMVAS